MWRLSKVALPLAGAAGTLLFAHLSTSFLIPLDHQAIQYARTPVTDVVSQLNAKIAAGKAKLTYDPAFGYLPSVLKALDVPVESQVLVFTKTSLQSPRIGPRTPRAIYHNDNVIVGWVRGGDVLEIAATDPKQGVVFYTINQEPLTKPRLFRDDNCLQCHASGGTLGVPGLFVRSVNPDPTGIPLLQAGSTLVNHETPFEKRWGGWYVSGSHGAQKHKGNAIARDRDLPEELETEGTQNLTDLSRKFDTGAYLLPHSDIVSLMVLEHQTWMTNLMIRVGFEGRLALHDQAAMDALSGGEPASGLSQSTERRINNAAEELVQYMLFTKEAMLTEPVKGTSGFTEVFPKSGPADKQGRSLRDLDMTRRMFKHPCSYMIYSDAFDGMPQPVLDRVYRRLWEVLSGQDTSPEFARLTAPERKAILQILRATKKNLPAYWRG